jgi:hypothetical protein
MTRLVAVANPLQYYGSFRDCLKAPIHRWFAYPAGYSYKLVEAKVRENSLNEDSLVGDPFLGTGTTCLAARLLGIPSIGTEAHVFVHWVAKVKLHVSYDLQLLECQLARVLGRARKSYAATDIAGLWPGLIYKCFTEDNMRKLGALRAAILDEDQELPETEFLKLGLTATLRIVTTAGAGWPYIAPSKYQARTVSRDALREFEKTCRGMIQDVQATSSGRRATGRGHRQPGTHSVGSPSPKSHSSQRTSPTPSCLRCKRKLPRCWIQT